MSKNVLVIGATSAIAIEFCRLHAKVGNKLFLCARSPEKLTVLASDLKIRYGAHVETMPFDAASPTLDFTAYIREVREKLSTIDIALIAYGTLPDQDKCLASTSYCLDEFSVNAVSYIGLLNELAGVFRDQRYGSLIVLGSCAGDRGRKSNFLYGASKAAVERFMQGLRGYLNPFGVHVMLVKPGFVDTPMTESFQKGILWAQPAKVANRINHCLHKKKEVVYAPEFWRYIMLIIKLIPEGLFKRLPL